MWGNLAGRLGATDIDINATLEKIGNVVAPPEDDDDDDNGDGYYDDADGSDGDFYDEDDDYGDDFAFDDDDDKNDAVNEIINKVAGSSPFRLAGLLTRSMDDRNLDIGNREYNGKNESGSMDNDANETARGVAAANTNILLFPRQTNTQSEEERVHNGDDKNDTGSDSHVFTKPTGAEETLQKPDKPSTIPGQTPTVVNQYHSSFDGSILNPSSAKSVPALTGGSSGVRSSRAFSGDIDEASNVQKGIPKVFQKPEEEAETKAKLRAAQLAESKARIAGSESTTDDGVVRKPDVGTAGRFSTTNGSINTSCNEALESVEDHSAFRTGKKNKDSSSPSVSLRKANTTMRVSSRNDSTTEGSSMDEATDPSTEATPTEKSSTTSLSSVVNSSINLSLSNNANKIPKPENIPLRLLRQNHGKAGFAPLTTTAVTTETKLCPAIQTKKESTIAVETKPSALVANLYSSASNNKSFTESRPDHNAFLTDTTESVVQQALDTKEQQTVPVSFRGIVCAPIVIEKIPNEAEEKKAEKIVPRDIKKVDVLPVEDSTTQMKTVVQSATNHQEAIEKEVDGTVSELLGPDPTEATDKHTVLSLSGVPRPEDARKSSSPSEPLDAEVKNTIENVRMRNSAILSAGTLHSTVQANDETPVEPALDNEKKVWNKTIIMPGVNEVTLDTKLKGDDKAPHTNGVAKKKMLDAEFHRKELQNQLEVAKQEIETLKYNAQRDKEKVETEREELIAQFHSRQVRLLQATSEENENQTIVLQQEYSARIQNLEHVLAKERKESQDEQSEYKRLLRESFSNLERTEGQLKATMNKYENEIAQAQQREERALRKVNDRMAQTMAVLDERDDEISRLKNSIRDMQSKVSEHQDGEEEAEEELEEIHQENDSLRHTIETLVLEKKKLKEQVGALKSGSEELSELQMELTMLKEERHRERTKNQAAVDLGVTSRAQIESERDNALSELRSCKQQLAAAFGDLEISRTDNSRIIMANNNLQSALEAFQDERQAEIEMIDEQRRESEDAIKSANEIATSAFRQIHETEMYEIQKASDNAVKNVMHEMELVEGTVAKLKSENNQLRRSLDEAIHRLQTTQEDVIDRNVMKNILVDWCTLNDKSKRQQVLQVMANLLHFSEDEKEKVHLTSKSLDSVRAKVVGALAAPLPPSKADVERLEGSNVHEKWVNFLMAETDDA